MTDETKTEETAEAPKKKTPAKKKPAASATERAKKAVAKKTAPKKKKKVLTEKQKEAAAAKELAEKAKAETLKSLTPIANEIRTRLEKADIEEGRALDHRVSAAIRLAEVKEQCSEAKISFKDWCEERLNTEKFTFGYEMARKLARIGSAGDEEEVKLALEDLRSRNAASNRKQREAKSDEKKQIGHNSAGAETGGKKSQPKPKMTIAKEAVSELDDKAAEELARDVAAEFDQRLVPDAEFKQWQKIKNMNPMELFEYAFGKLGDKDKQTALERMADDLGATLEFPE